MSEATGHQEMERRLIQRSLEDDAFRQKLVPPKGFEVLPRRWVVGRTFAWIGHNRRMKDYEWLCATGEASVYAAMTRLIVRRLARA